MKKCCLLATTLLVALFLPLSASAEEAQTLRITLQLPLKHHLGANLQNFKQEVEKESNGNLKVEIYPSAQLYKDKEVPEAVASGAIEMGVVSVPQYAGTIPAIDIFYVPFVFDTPEKVKKATAPGSPIRSELDAAILKTGTRVLWWQAYGSSIILTKDKPVRLPGDLKGMKIRVYGKTLGDMATTLGAAPTMLSGSQQFMAYQRGTVDAGMTGITPVKSRKLYEVMDNMTLTYNADIEFVVIINEQLWQKLSDTQKTIITKSARRVEKELREKVGKIEEADLAFVKTKMNVISLSNEERDLWRKATAPVVKSYIQRTGDLGKKLIDEAAKL
jgi:C4-dicarboxylate-binding protein DctP